MGSWILLSGIIAPAAFWIGYYRWKDAVRPEPVPVLLGTYVLGVCAGLLALRGYQFLETAGIHFPSPHGEPVAFALHALLVIGPVEEAAKLLPFLLVSVRLRHFDEPVDGVVYAACIALGFASYENLFYLDEHGGMEQLGRAIASPLVHTMFATYWGVSAARARLEGRSLFRPVAAAFLIAALLHGLYDAMVFDPILRIGAAALVLAMWICQMVRIRRMIAQARAARHEGTDKVQRMRSSG